MVDKSIGSSAAKKHDEKQLVVFKVGNEEFGVDINEVREINRWEAVTRIPNSAAYIKGVINLRGNIIVVTDLAMKLGMPSKEVDDDTRILVVELENNETVGMVVDSATEVLRISGEKIRDAPNMITSNIDANYIEGVGLLDNKRLLTLLDLAKVLESEDYEKILNAQKVAERNVLKKEEKKPDIVEKPESVKKDEPKKDEKKDDAKKQVEKEDKKDDTKKDNKKEENEKSKDMKEKKKSKEEDKLEKQENNKNVEKTKKTGDKKPHSNTQNKEKEIKQNEKKEDNKTKDDKTSKK